MRSPSALSLAFAALLVAHADRAQAQCDPIDGGVIAPVQAELCGRDGTFTILSQSDGSLGTSVLGGGVPTGGSTGGSCSLLGCLVAGAGTGGGCTYGYSWEKSVDGGPFTAYIPFSGTKQLAPSDSTGFSNSGYRIFSYRRFLESSSGAPPVSSNVVVLTQYASWSGGVVSWNPDPAQASLNLTIPCGGVAPAIAEETGSPARFHVNPSGSPTPPFEHKWQAFYGGAWRGIHYTVNGTFFPQGRPDLDATLVNSEFNAHAELVGQEYVLKFRRLARPAGKCEFHPAEFDVTLRRPLSTPIVTTTADSQAGSLRNAVTLACAEDIVTFSPSLGGSTITLSSAITIPRNLTIKGDGANRISISGNGTTRAFVVPPGTNATLSSLDIVGVRVPSSSGAIFNQGNLSLRDMTFRDGQGGVTSFPGSKLRVVDSAFHGNDTLAPDRTSRFSGGGISAIGSVTQPTSVEVINSTFSGNRAGGGGAIACQGCDLILRNSTLTNNTADGTAGGLVTASDGSGKASSVTLSGTIIAGNTAGLGGPDVYSYGATWTSGGHNLLGSNQDAFDFHPVATDKFGTPALLLAPNLAPLSNNGGFTKSHALQCASPAFDAGDPADGSADQIGQTPFSIQRDIGAFESQQPLARVASGFRSEAAPANPLLVNFTDLSTGLPTSWSWDFGDGTTSTQQSPTHTYAAPGSYAACLTASSACGSTAAQCDAEVLSADVPKPVLDNQTITSKLVINSLANVGDLKVRVDVKHTFRGDVRLTLISPAGTRVLLKQTSGDSADDIVGTYGANLTSAQPLTLLEGQPAGGTWTLEAFDGFAGDTGRIAGWGLAICEARDCVKADATGLPLTGTLAAPATSSLQLPSGPPIDRVRVRVDVSGFLLATGAGASTSILKLELRSPSGTRITLSDGGPGPAPLPNRLTGTFGLDLTSLQTLDAFQGQSPAGAWDLIVSPRPPFPTYGGRIDAWSLQTCAAGDVTKCRPVTLCGSGFVPDGAGGCVDFDECVPFFNACSAGSTCTNLPGGFTCDCVDDDADDLCAAADNCPAIFNPDQENFDADALGDVCDPDANGDDVLDATAVETINNGGAPPSPANVVDAGDGTRFSHVEVRSLGCGPGSCPMPWGAQTQATLEVGGKILGDLRARESSIVRMNGGSVGGSLIADDASRVELTGGAVALDLLSLGFGSIEMRGGSVGRDIIATAGSNIKIVGTGFAVDGVPVGPGPIAAQTGVLTGELAFGEAIHNRFCHNGCTLFPFAATGLITLEEPIVDADGDGVADGTDNCTQKANPAQVDADADGIGNQCDADFNNDGIVNFLDLAAMKAAFFTTDPVVDLNADGFVNFLDLSILKQSFFQPPGPAAGGP